VDHPDADARSPARAALNGTGLTDSQKLRTIGLLSSYTLSEARFANDAARAAAAAAKAAAASGSSEAPGPPLTYELLLRELVDEQTFPNLYRIAWSAEGAGAPTEREEFLAGVDLILDGVQALIDRAAGGY
jgi:hypothetical protein